MSANDPFDLLREHINQRFDAMDERLDEVRTDYLRVMDATEQHRREHREDERRAWYGGGALGGVIGGAVAALAAYFGMKPQ